MSKFISKTPNCPVVDDSVNLDQAKRDWEREHGKGTANTYVPRDLDADPLGSHECAAAGRIKIIPEVEWKERIIEMEAKGQTALDLLETYKMPPLHQGRTKSCWAQAVTDAAHFAQADAGGPVVRLSTGSTAGPIKGYRNRGGNCIEAAKRGAEFGICRASLWPENANTDRRLWTPETEADAAQHKILEWDDMKSRDWAEFVSTLLTPGRTVAYCNYSMSHAVLAIKLIYNSRGQLGVLTRNSGLYRDKNGFTQFFGKRAVPDDAISIRVFSIDARAKAA